MKISRAKGLFKNTDAFPLHEGRLYERIHYEDLHGVGFLSSSQLYNLIDNVKKMLDTGIETRLINVSPEVKKQLQELNLEDIITFE